MTFCVIIIIICAITGNQAKPQYTIEIIDVEYNFTLDSNFEMELKISRPSRGVLAISGFFDFKEDINTDNAVGWVNVYYSPNAISYVLTPYRIPHTIFTDGVNFLYKHYLMDTVKGCCENAIDFEGTFVQPLTKRRMIFKDCVLKNDNYPPHMRMGFYKFEGVSTGEITFVLTLTVKLEKE